MAETITEWGVWKGVSPRLKRLARGHPWGTSQYDAVPRKPAAREVLEEIDSLAPRSRKDVGSFL
ncbi:membrane protein insertion efficiency factor YidD [Parapedobacter sp. ISTM3]|nr:membrane protein insertion efficiency factor YidD [Parapedobacter sp. ISTM3]